MDDPWAAWGTPKKPSPKAAPRLSFSPPPEELDVNDPWATPRPKAAPAAAPAPAPAPLTSDATSLPLSSSPPKAKVLPADLPTSLDAPSSSFPLAPKPIALASGGPSGAWGEDSGWDSKPSLAEEPMSLPALPRSPSPEIGGADPWGAGTAAAAVPDDAAATDTAALSLSRQHSRGSVTALPGLESPARSASPGPSLGSPVKSVSPVSVGPRKSVEATRLSIEDEFRRSLEMSSPRRSVDSPAFSSPRTSLDPDTSFGAPLALPEATGMRRSPSFGSDFGDFGAAGDPWGTNRAAGAEAADHSWGAAGDDDESDEENAGWGVPKAKESATDATRDEYESWGGQRKATPPSEPTAQETDWQAAQRRIAVADARAPFDKVNAIKKGWDEVAAVVVGESFIPFTEEEEEKLNEAVKELEDKVADTMRTLATLPPDTNTYPAVLSSLTTHQKLQAALARPNPNPQSSLLHAPIRARRLEGLSFGQGLEGSWGGRSRLGEPDAVNANLEPSPTDSAQGGSRWSFWRKSAPPKPLHTSGGGILEVKDVSAGNSPAPSPIQALKSTTPVASPVEVKPTTPIAATGSTPRASTSSAPIGTTGTPIFSLSRPGTPDILKPSSRSASPAPIPTDDPDDPDAAAGSAAPAPSAVSRFWGRFGRRQSQQSNVQTLADNKEDLELSADDFAFLGQVPAMPTAGPGTGDLLSMSSGPITDFDSMLKPSGAALPAPLAPPPRGPPLRTASGSSGRFPAARMSSGPAPPRQSDVDLLSGLDFDAPSSSPTTALSNTTSPTSATSMSAPIGWDDILAPSAPTPKATGTSTPPIAPPPGRTSSSLTSPSLFAPPPSGRVPSPIAPPRVSTPPIAPRISSPLTSQPLNAGLMQPTAPQASRPVSMAFDSTPLAPKPPRPMSVMGSAPLTPTTAGSRQPSMSGLGSVSPPGTSPLAPQRSLSPPVNQGLGFGMLQPTTSSLSSLTPSPAPSPAPMAAPMAPSFPSLAPPAAPATPQRPPASPGMDDFADFGDFSSFATPQPASADTSGDFDDFGDFSAAADRSFDSPAPIPIEKSPAYARPAVQPNFGAASVPTPPPLFARPAGHTRAPSMGLNAFGQPIPDSASSKVVDHSPTLSLVTAASHSPGQWPAPPSPVPQRLAPPPGSGTAAGGARNGSGGGLVDLLGD